MFANWYSGATLFAILLNNHDDISCGGETFPFKVEDTHSYICSCGNILHECEYYRTAAGHMLNGEKDWNGDVFIVLPQFAKSKPVNKWLKSFNYFPKFRDGCIEHIPHFREKTIRFLRAHHDFYEKSCQYNGSSVYIDGTKSVRRAELFARHLEKDFKVLHLIRDGRGFCNSFIKNKKLSKAHLPEAAAAWLEYIDMVETFSKRYPSLPMLTVRYEDLCADLEQNLRRICAFLGVDFDGKMINGSEKTYHILGNAMRKTFTGEVREDLSWKTRLTAGEINQITALMEKGLRKYGYL